MKPRPKAHGADPIRAQVRARYSNPFRMMELSTANFHRELPSRAERVAFAQEFPTEFLGEFGFVIDPDLDSYPASAHYGEPFRRELEFFKGIDVATTFDPPDCSNIPYRERYATMAHARGEWWIARGLPMSRVERAWLAERAAPAQPEGAAANILKFKQQEKQRNAGK